MGKTKYGRILIGVLCVLVLVAVTAAALLLDKKSPDPIVGDYAPYEPPKPTTVPDNPFGPPTYLPPSVTIPPEEGKTEITFPCDIPGYDLTIEKADAYSGMYVEDGSFTNVANVAMLLVHNKGSYPVEFTRISLSFGEKELLFDISALPAGQRVVVQEKNGKAYPEEKANAASAMVIHKADLAMSEGQISVTDNGNNTLTITNLTGEMIPTVRVFYKHYMKNEQVFVGGIAFTVRITRLGAGASVTIQPSHFNSQTSRLVMALTYDSEV